MSELRPIFIVGTGRCGSTALHDLLSRHPQAIWLSVMCNRRPKRPELNARIMQGLRVPGLSGLLRRLYPPAEVYAFWDHLCPGFSRPMRDLRASDVTIRVRDRMREALATATPDTGRPLLTKFTGWPRVGFLKEVFPRARFVMLTRDGRAVISSGMAVPWSEAFFGPSGWRWGPVIGEDLAAWKESRESFVVLSGLGWKNVIEAQEAVVREAAPEDLLELRYEGLCDDPIGVLREVATFCELDWTPAFEAAVRNAKLVNQNHKWSRNFTEGQQAELERVLGPTLTRLGYQ